MITRDLRSARTLNFVSQGVRISVRANRPEVLEGVSERLPPDWRPAPGSRAMQRFSLRVAETSGAGHELWKGAECVARSQELDEVLDELESWLHFSVAALAPRNLFVHAGVLAWNGRALLLPGRSHSGKTTLVRALVRAGATYYSDEYAVLDPTGLVRPYPKRLSIRHPGTNRPRRVSVESLGGSAGTTRIPPGLVIVARYEAGAVWAPRRLSPGEALLALLENTVRARSRARAALDILGRVVEQAPAWEGVRGDAEAVAGHLLHAGREPSPLVERRASR